MRYDENLHFQRHHRADAKRRDPVIQLYDRLSCRKKQLDCRVKPGNDALGVMCFENTRSPVSHGNPGLTIESDDGDDRMCAHARSSCGRGAVNSIFKDMP